jgi:hypothetical protein
LVVLYAVAVPLAFQTPLPVAIAYEHGCAVGAFGLPGGGMCSSAHWAVHYAQQISILHPNARFLHVAISCCRLGFRLPFATVCLRAASGQANALPLPPLYIILFALPSNYL